MHFLVIEGDSNIVVVNIAAFDISLLLARTSIFVSQKLLPAQLWFHVVNLLPLSTGGGSSARQKEEEKGSYASGCPNDRVRLTNKSRKD